MALTMDQVPALLNPNQLPLEERSRVPPNFQDNAWGRNYLLQSAKAAVRGGGVAIATGPAGCGAVYMPPGPGESRQDLVRASSGVVPPIYGRVGPGLTGHDPMASSPAQIALLARAVRRPPVNAAPPLLQDLDRDQLDPTTRLGRVLRNYNARAVSRRGGIMPAYATRTGDIPLPNPLRYDPMGYAYALGPEPRYAELTPAAEFAFDETPVMLAGFGEAVSETPEVRQLPWEIGRGPGAAELAVQRSEKRWSKAAVLVGILGGTLGIILSWKALKGRG